MKPDRRCLLPLGVALLAGCYQLPLQPHHVVASEPVTPPGETVQAPPRRIEPVVLYARDGTPVATGDEAVVSPETGTPVHGLEEPQESRLYLLELYQRAVDERDELAIEVDGLDADLDEARACQKQQELENAELRRVLQEARADLERLRTRETELAGRLATAQIRRLEAEKVLLETTLEWDRLNRLAQPPREGAEQ